MPQDMYSFVYRITNTLDGRMYIGKKLIWFKGFKSVKGKKKRILKESDWRTYCGSNTELQHDIKQHGIDQFTFHIEGYFKTKGEASYHEARLQLLEDVLYYPDKYYNQYVGCRIHRSHLKLGQ